MLVPFLHIKNLRKRCFEMKNKKWEEAFNLPTVDDLFEPTHGDYIGRVEKG